MRLPFIILLSCFSVACYAQQDSTLSTHILHKLAQYGSSHPGEKVYLNFDRPYYAAGDTVYYKAYLTLAGRHTLSALSGILYVQLIDNYQGKALFTERLEIINGVAWGDFSLPDTLTGSSYSVRAYTTLMRNNGETDFFQQNIPIVIVKPPKNNTSSITTLPSATATATATSTQILKPDIRFFPEGGTLISGVKSKIAFKAVGVNGLGINVKGELTDSENNQVCTFASAHLGMGCFYFIPKQGEIYKANITYAGGRQETVSLPLPDETVSLSAINDSLLVVPVTINASVKYFAFNKGKTFILAVYSGGELTNIPCRLDSATVQAYLYKKKLHTGITRLTLFSPAGEPVCERLLFINNNDHLRLSVNADKPVYAAREKVTVKLNAQDARNLPVKGDFSVTVTDESKLPVDSDSENTIVNYLLLTSELKGNIEQPGYYFNHSTEKIQNDLDNLMLTQGYRRFEWKQVLNATDTAIHYLPEKTFSVSGTVETAAGKPLPGAEVSLGVISPLLAKDTLADANGNFRFNDLYIADTARLLIRAGKGNKNWKAEIAKEDEPTIEKLLPLDTVSTIAAVKPQVATAMKKEYEQYGNMHTGIMLKQVNITEKTNPLHLTPLLHSDNLNGAGMANQVIMGDQMTGCPDVASCLAYLMHGGMFGSGAGGKLVILNPRNHAPMAVLLNGIITDQSALDRITTLDVYSVEILESPYYLTIYGTKAAAGLLVINTRRGNERANVNIQPGLTTYLFNGFYKARQFYAPAYAVKTGATTPDIRTTLAWKPVILTDKDGNALFDFYTSDHTASYRVQIEGIDAAGNLGTCILHCVVK